MDAAKLHEAIEKVCPIDGVSIGKVSDRSTWRIGFHASATDAQRSDAMAVLVAYDGEAPAVPASVKMWQAKAALASIGKLDAANSAINAGGHTTLQLAWEYATDVSRNSPAVSAISQVLGMSPSDVDALFIAASKIAV